VHDRCGYRRRWPRRLQGPRLLAGVHAAVPSGCAMSRDGASVWRHGLQRRARDLPDVSGRLRRVHAGLWRQRLRPGRDRCELQRRLQL